MRSMVPPLSGVSRSLVVLFDLVCSLYAKNTEGIPCWSAFVVSVAVTVTTPRMPPSQAAYVCLSEDHPDSA
jgi:hypothetical protein